LCFFREKYVSRKIYPPATGAEKLYEHLDSKVLQGDLCNFIISLPTTADPNDVLTFKMQYLAGGVATLVQGKNLATATRKYTLKAG